MKIPKRFSSVFKLSSSKSKKHKKHKRQTRLLRSPLVTAQLVVYCGTNQQSTAVAPQSFVETTPPTPRVIPVGRRDTEPVPVVAETAITESTPEPSPTPSPMVDTPKNVLETCRNFCQRLLGASEEEIEVLRTEWQNLCSRLSRKDQELVRHHADKYLPEIHDSGNEKAVNFFWNRVFYRDNIAHLKHIISGPTQCRKKGYGMVYYYLVNDKVRYVGQTKEKGLYWRMAKGQFGVVKDYNAAIKCNLINAYRSGRLKVQTQIVNLANIDSIQEFLIKRYAPHNNLWNVRHNDYFHVSNYQT